MKVVTEATDWPKGIRRASINSFGYGGANSHAILESIDSVLPGYRLSKFAKSAKDSTKHYVLPFSASSLSSLESRILDLSTSIHRGEEYDFDDLCYTLAHRRSVLTEKGFLIANEATAKHDFRLEGLVTSKKPSPCLPLGFIFTGQGAQWPQMGKELLTKYPEYLKTIQYLDSVLRNLPEAPSWTLEASILEPSDTSRVSEVTHSQPLCTAIQIAMVDLISSWGIRPSVVAGHSSGEIAAAYTAGLLSSAQAIIVAYYRGYVVGKARSEGAMLAAGINVELANEIIHKTSLDDQVVVACVNSPESVTFSGSTQGIDQIFAELQTTNSFARKLKTGRKAYHSHMMREIGDEYASLLTTGLQGLSRSLNPSEQGPIKMFSSVGADHEALECFTQESVRFLPSTYWRRNLESPVQFHTALKNMAATGKYHLIEIGPHSALELPIKQTRTFLGLPEEDLLYNSTLSRGKDAEICLKTLAGHLFLHGHSLEFSNVNGVGLSNGTRSEFLLPDLPPYRWNYGQLLWNEPRSSVEFRNRQYVRHELLGSRKVAGNGIEYIWRNILKLKEVPWLEDHKVFSCLHFKCKR